jgi:tetratricopeptide (TPR) repeat protein
MPAKFGSAIAVAMILIAGIFNTSSANAQDTSATSLTDRLKAQYKLAKIVPELNGYKVAEPGTMLVIQKDGIFGVPLGSNSVDPVIYAIQKDTDLHHSDLTASSWKFGVGHKVYLSKLDVDAKHEKVSFTIVECDSSDPVKPSYYKSIVDFEFPSGYLAGAEVGQIEDVISQVLTIDNGTNDPRPGHGSQTSSAILTNDDIIKLVQAKLPDSIVIAKIKSSSSEFDTSTEALIKLKQAGVSEPVLQAILDAGTQSNPSDSGENSPTVPTSEESATSPVCADYESCLHGGQGASEAEQWDQALAYFQKASSLGPTETEPLRAMALVYLALGEYGEAPAMWDKTLRLGGTLSFDVMHRKGFSSAEKGILLLSISEISFLGPAQEKVFSVAPHAISFHGRGSGSAISPASLFALRIGGKTYRFYPKPVGFICERVSCEEPGLSEQTALAKYMDETISKLQSGELKKD